jgi:hypothetical protein
MISSKMMLSLAALLGILSLGMSAQPCPAN